MKRIFVALVLALGYSRGQVPPDAPPAPVCAWDRDGVHSTCKFKDALAGTPTSVAGNQVIVFRYNLARGEGSSRTYLDNAVTRLSERYGFTAKITENPNDIEDYKLVNTKVVIMNNGDGDVLKPGPNRKALEDFQQVHGWGVIWIHAACAFISNGWPFGQQSCVQQYYYHEVSGTIRRMFMDSGTATNPNQGIRNPQSEFLLRDLPGWSGKRTLQMMDEFFCFRAPARNTPGVNVLFGYDHGSGRAPEGCPDAADTSEAASQNHNMVWTHAMGKGISIYNSWGHDESAYTGSGNMGDSLLWRFIRYAAKDWCVAGSGEPGCDAPTEVRRIQAAPAAYALRRNGSISLSIPDAGPFTAVVSDLRGAAVGTGSGSGPARWEIAGLRPGLYLVRIRGRGKESLRRIMAH